MPATIKTTPELVRATGSHSLSLNVSRYRGPGSEPFDREEVYPILEVDAPRVGKVRAQFRCDRYVASVWHEEDGTSTDEMGAWRIILGDVRTADPDRPDVVHLGQLAAGVGPAARSAISAACEPIIRAWLDSDEYREARRRAAARAVVSTFEAPRSYTLDRAAETLAAVDAAGEISTDDRAEMARALDDLRRALDRLERVTAAD